MALPRAGERITSSTLHPCCPSSGVRMMPRAPMLSSVLEELPNGEHLMVSIPLPLRMNQDVG